jgi:hypothetical protein
VKVWRGEDFLFVPIFVKQITKNPEDLSSGFF